MSESYQITTLANGLRVATQPMEGMQTVAFAVSVDVGARYESESENGLSHFLEHMAFKGTKRRNALQIAEEMDAIGASVNAFTSSEHTVYYARFLPQDLERVVDVLADIMQHSTFNEVELERERGVILQEIAMHSDAPEDLVYDYFHEVLYPNQAMGRSILGTPERVKSFSADDLRGYMHKHYVPARMVITASGKVSHQEVVDLVTRYFTEYPEKGARVTPAPMKYHGGEKRVVQDFEQMHLVMGFQGVAFNDPDYYAAQVMATVLGGGMSSRLFQEVREKRGLVYNVYAFLSGYEEAGIFGVYAAASEASAKELAPVLCDEIRKLARDGISETELSRAKRQHTAGLRMVVENVSSVAEWMGRHLFYYGAFRDMDEMTAHFEAVNAVDVQRVLKRILASGPVSLSVLGPQTGLATYEEISHRFDDVSKAA